MSYFVLKAILSGILIAAISEIARRSPGVAALVASLPLLSILGVVWLWRDTGDTSRIGSHLEATFWYVLPSLPMFLVVPGLMRGGLGFWISLGLGCGLTIAIYFLLLWLAPRFNLPL
jgi:hypothetical protein